MESDRNDLIGTNVMGIRVSINGIDVVGLLQADISSNNLFSSDAFSLVFATGHMPFSNLASWAEVSELYVDISYIDDKLSSSSDMISGMVDSLVVDPILGTISIEGRDLSARLVDSYVQRDFVNQTASEIVGAIAAEYGLDTQASVTFGNIGRYFGDGYTRLSLGLFSRVRSSWDLVVQLAREQGFDVFVQGKTLVFQPVANGSDIAMQIWPSDVTGMRFERNLAIGATPRVQVQSWNSQQQEGYGSDSSTLLTSASVISNSFLFSKSNLTSSQADLSVQQYSAEIGRLRTSLHIDMPWNLEVSARSLILAQGTGSSFDGLYQIDSVERRFCSRTGSSQTVRAISWPLVG